MKRFWILLVAMCALGLSGCNTVEGFGKDVKKVGEKMEDAAARRK